MGSESAQEIIDRLEAPILELRFLLERGYRRSHALRAVGEHHQLILHDLNVLERVVFPSSEARARRERLIPADAVSGRSLIIDGYNQLISLECLLASEPLFLADDGLVRDIAAIRGGYARNAATTEALGIICQFLAQLDVVSARVVFDRQVSRSGELAAACREALSKAGVPGEAITDDHTDQYVRHASAEAVACSSDRAIIDGAPHAFDLIHTLAQEHRSPLGYLPPPLMICQRNN